MWTHLVFIHLGLLVVFTGGPAQLALAKCLFREPPDSVAPPQQTDSGFYLAISGDPIYYEAGSLYTVSLRVRKST